MLSAAGGRFQSEFTLFLRVFAPTTLAVRLSKSPPWTQIHPHLREPHAFACPRSFSISAIPTMPASRQGILEKSRDVALPGNPFIGCSHHCRWSSISGMGPARMAGPDSGRCSRRRRRVGQRLRAGMSALRHMSRDFLGGGRPTSGVSPTLATARSHPGDPVRSRGPFFLARHPVAGREAGNRTIAEAEPVQHFNGEVGRLRHHRGAGRPRLPLQQRR